ncbi:hypothetical protein VQZ33_002934 [Salmonella enterica]|nr:hypothetical protein [Salmonella enterica]EMD3058120.1 hypothetical protein [Salmonella enterica]EMD3062717.1 hypothetical protein [Salmonella enterica]EMD3094569.1 hypothetical protein [Salmonella enterica]EMD3454720.1 hypothetical protein [Salmonella enterica]
MNEKTTLTVFKNSPHIWSGGLEGEDLANWLISKANAILYLKEYQERRARISAEFVSVESCAKLIEDYASLGISSEENSSIHQLSMEAIIHAGQVATLLFHGLREGESSVMPLEYSLLPDLSEEFEAAQKKKVEINNHLIARFGEIPGGAGRLPPQLWCEKPHASFDYLKEEYQDAGTNQHAAMPDSQEATHQSFSSD